MNDENLIPAKKGEIRNPFGRKKGTPNFKTIIKKYFKQKIKLQNPLTDKEEKIIIKAALVLSMMRKAINDGSVQAADWLANHEEGLLKQKTEHSGNIDLSDIKEMIKSNLNLNDTINHKTDTRES